MSNDIIILKLQNRGMPGTGISEIEKNQITSDIAEIQGRPVIVEMSDLDDVDTTGVADGDTLVYDLDTETWLPGTVQGGLAEARDFDGTSETPIAGPLTSIQAYAPIRAELHPTVPNMLRIKAAVGTAWNTVAAGNHTHMQPLPVRVTTAPTGYMSGGSRSIGTTSVALTEGVQHVVEAAVYGQVRGADPGAAYYTITLNIGGNTYTSPGGSDGFWCVQGVPDKPLWEYERRMTGTGASVSVSASIAFHSGSGFNVDRMYLRVRVRPDR